MAFNSKMKTYKLYKPVVITNELNEKVITYQFLRNIKMSLAQSAVNSYQGNDTNVINVEFLGLTTDRYIQKGYRIDDDYIVSYVEVNRMYSILHLVEIDNNGRLQSSNR